MKRELIGLPLLWTTLALAASSCTQAEPPRSFVQPNALRKADFTGTWYYNATVIEAPPTNGTLYIGQSGELQKINWVITENTLFAVRSYPLVTNSEDTQTGALSNPDNESPPTAPPNQYEGAPLGAWTITSQFDIIRDYNATTGEQTNQIIESQERPWNEREYFRVDWSTNLAPDWTGIGLDFTLGGVQFTDLGYFVSDPTSPDAMHVERGDSTDVDLGFAAGEMDYFDTTSELIAQPVEQSFVIDAVGDTEMLPVCLIYSYNTQDCAAQQIKLRNAFAKVAPNDTYEAKEWDGIDQNNFGFFTTGLRQNWNRQYGDTYTGAKRWVDRFNLWKGSCALPGSYCEAPHRVRDPNDGSWLLNLSDADLLAWEENPGNGAAPLLSPDSGYQPQGVYISELTALAAQIPAAAATANPSQPTCQIQSAIPFGDAGPLRNTTDDCAPVALPNDAFLLLGTDGVLASEDINWIPYSQRTQVTIPYYPNDEMPADIWPVAQEVINQWNNAFKQVVLDEYLSDPNSANMTIADIQDVFVWCHNPVQVGDPAACMQHLKPEVNPDGSLTLDSNGNPIYAVRQGDPRRSSILWIDEYQANGLLGFGPSLSDPETGETISAQANIYGGNLDTYAAWARDLILLMGGKTDPNSYVEGVQADAWVKCDPAGATTPSNACGSGASPYGVASRAYKTSDTQSHYDAMDWSWAAGKPLLNTATSHDPVASFQGLQSMLGNGLSAGLFGTGSGDTQQALLNTLRGTPMETQLMVPEISQAMGIDPTTGGFESMPASLQAQYSALNSEGIKSIVDQNMMMLEAFGFDVEPFNYNVLGSEVQRYAGQTDLQAIWEDLRQRIFLGVTLHEVGHNMGLRHNFRGSYDSLNYFPSYWALRQAAATADHPLDVSATSGRPKLYPRSFAYLDGGTPGAYTALEVDGGELENQYSSIMDYGAMFDTALQGLGHYDKAAVKYGYANAVEVFSSTSSNLTPLDASGKANDHVQTDKLGNLQAFKDAYGFPSAIVGNPATGAQAINYWSYPDMFQNGVADLESRRDVSLYDINTLGFLAPDWAGINFGNPYQSSVQGVLDSNNQVEPLVPYFFCSDEFAGNLTCQRFDFGADAWEQSNDIINRYQNWYLVRNFKRDQYSFHSGTAYTDYTYNRYFEMLRIGMAWLSLLGGDFNDNAQQLENVPGVNFGASTANVRTFLTDEVNGWGTFTDSVNDSFNLFGQVLTVPQAGTFVANPALDGTSTLVQINDALEPAQVQQVNAIGGDGSAALLDITQGRYLTTTWNFNGCGAYWADECQNRIGYFTDKWLALRVLSENVVYFLGFDTAVDVRQYNIGYWLPYKAQLGNLFSAMLSGKTSELGYLYNGYGGDPIPQDIIYRTPAPAPSNGKPLTVYDPGLGFSLQIWAGVYGMSGFTSGFDHSFVNNSQLFVVGNGEAPVPDVSLLNADGTPGPLATTDPTQLVSACADSNTEQQNACIGSHKQWFIFKDPLSAKVYAALSVAPSKIISPAGDNFVREDLGVRMLQAASTLAADLTADPSNAGYQQTYLEYQENIDMMRSLVNAFGYGPYASVQMAKHPSH